MGMTNEKREKHIRIANMLIELINDVQMPMLLYQIEKDVAKEALENYIKMLEQQPCEDCINRYELSEAISALTYWHFNDDGKLEIGGAFDNTVYKVADVERLVRVLPPVQPQPFINKPCVSEGACREDKIKVLDKIKAEIDQKQYDFMDDKDYDEGIRFGLMLAYQIIDKYKVENEEEK